jgi:hypothetical protein
MLSMKTYVALKVSETFEQLQINIMVEHFIYT